MVHADYEGRRREAAARQQFTRELGLRKDQIVGKIVIGADAVQACIPRTFVGQSLIITCPKISMCYDAIIERRYYVGSAAEVRIRR